MIALAERGALFDPGPCMYMEKLAVGPAVDPKAVSLNMSITENLEVVAKSLSKPIGYASAVSPKCCFPFLSKPAQETGHLLQLTVAAPACYCMLGSQSFVRVECAAFAGLH